MDKFREWLKLHAQCCSNQTLQGVPKNRHPRVRINPFGLQNRAYVSEVDTVFPKKKHKMEMEQQYSELLHNSAEKWGLNILPGRPLVGLVPCSRRPDGIIGNPYQPKPISIVETFVYRAKKGRSRGKVELFMFNGLWGYCLDISTKNYGFGYGPFLKFCKPYQTRLSAIGAAVAEIMSRVHDDNKLVRWARSLTASKQLILF